MANVIEQAFDAIEKINPYFADPNNIIQDGINKGRSVKDIKDDMRINFAMGNVNGDIEKETRFLESVANINYDPNASHEIFENVEKALQEANDYDGPGDLHKEALKIGKRQRESIYNSPIPSHSSRLSSTLKENTRALIKIEQELDDTITPSLKDAVIGIFSKDKRKENRQAQKKYNNLQDEYDKAYEKYSTAWKALQEDKKAKDKGERKQRIVDNLRDRYIVASDNYNKIKSHNEKLKQVYLNTLDQEGYDELKAEWDKKAPAAFDASQYDTSTPEGQQKLQEAQAKHQELVDKHKQGFSDQIKANKENVLNADFKKYEQAAMDSFQEDIVEARRRGGTFTVTDSMKRQKMQEMIAKDFDVSMNDAGRGIDILKSKMQEQKILDLKKIIGSRLDAYDTSEKEVKDANGKITKEKDFKALASRKAGSSGIKKAAEGGWKGKAAIFGGVAAAALATVGIGSMMMSGGRQSNSNLYNPYQAMY